MISGLRLRDLFEAWVDSVCVCFSLLLAGRFLFNQILTEMFLDHKGGMKSTYSLVCYYEFSGDIFFLFNQGRVQEGESLYHLPN